ncbi:shikimate dehydrogenase [Pectinatus frisingensis]|uniref:shikimate dehydrogenase n=1 Tax=Pectinatus frisingensis TaxID=865 RepID=UPI0018C670AF|nr:shikimate dehydrogenase [Pectinatus frisingensis]
MLYTGNTKNLGVVGNPIHHSLSPVIQNTVLQSMQLDYAYIAMKVNEKDLPIAVAGLKALHFCGFNITIPHKINIMQYLDDIDPAAQLIGAVNTVVIKNNKLYGYNTDYEGFITALYAKNFPLKNNSAVILGAGGAARAVIYGLHSAGIKTIHIGARNIDRARHTAADFSHLTDIHTYNWTEYEFKKILHDTPLLINTTPLGMYPHIDEMPPIDISLLPASTLVYDVIYTPEKTKLLKTAETMGHPILNGEYMLAGQGAAALKKWLGRKDIDIDLMRIALHDALQKKL